MIKQLEDSKNEYFRQMEADTTNPQHICIDHDFRYNDGKEFPKCNDNHQARRICTKCLLKQVQGRTERNEWFNSFFAVLYIEGKTEFERDIYFISTWSKEPIDISHAHN